MAVASSISSLFSTLKLHSHPSEPSLSASSKPHFYPLRRPTSSIPPSRLQGSPQLRLPLSRAKSSDEDGVDTSFFDDVNPEEEVPFEQVAPPEDYVPFPSFDELPPETEEQIAAAYEEIYGPAYSGMSILGNDIYVMDSKVKKTSGFGSKKKKEKVRDGFEERVVQVRRVTKVVKGGKQLSFRAIVIVGNKQGQVGVGVGKAKEVISAVEKSATNARRNLVTVPMTKNATFPHRADGDYGAAKVMLRPASPGTGVIAGGAVRIVLEMAGVENALGKQLGSKNPLNNARATVEAVSKMRHFKDVAAERGIPVEELWK
ncbi:30S ribosomal protein S5, chloroplastic [Nymphaea colorata]|nr:30S ribosomal protein S5, chloroplastic [Nymphaea colorata]